MEEMLLLFPVVWGQQPRQYHPLFYILTTSYSPINRAYMGMKNGINDLGLAEIESSIYEEKTLDIHMDIDNLRVCFVFYLRCHTLAKLSRLN